MSFDVARVRGLYPTLGSGIVHLEGTYGALQPEAVVRAIVGTLRSAPAQPGSRSERSRRAAASVENAQRAIGDLVGAPAQSVVIGGSVTALLTWFAAAVSRTWQLGDEIVLSRLDNDETVRVWTTAARSVGAAVHFAEADVETGELPDWQYEALVGRHTRLVTVPLANPVTGAVPDVKRITEVAHGVGALVAVDAGAAPTSLPLDLSAFGADLLTVRSASFGGPTMAALIMAVGVRHEIERLPASVRRSLPVIGPLPVELLDGVPAAVDHLAALDEAATGSRRERLLASVTSARGYQERLFERLDTLLRRIPGVTLIGSPVPRVPVLAFTVAGALPNRVGDFLYSRGLAVWTGPPGMSELMTALGIDELGGAVHVGLMPHTTYIEVDQLAIALDDLLGSRQSRGRA
jgi:cysteine desulfurase family protein (TIGR01976 family)